MSTQVREEVRNCGRRRTRLTIATNPGMLSLEYAVGLTYTFDFVYKSLYLLPSESSWWVAERSSVFCLLISTISSVWGDEGGAFVSVALD